MPEALAENTTPSSSFSDEQKCCWDLIHPTAALGKRSTSAIRGNQFIDPLCLNSRLWLPWRHKANDLLSRRYPQRKGSGYWANPYGSPLPEQRFVIMVRWYCAGTAQTFIIQQQWIYIVGLEWQKHRSIINGCWLACEYRRSGYVTLLRRTWGQARSHRPVRLLARPQKSQFR